MNRTCVTCKWHKEGEYISSFLWFKEILKTHTCLRFGVTGEQCKTMRSDWSLMCLAAGFHSWQDGDTCGINGKFWELKTSL